MVRNGENFEKTQKVVIYICICQFFFVTLRANLRSVRI